MGANHIDTVLGIVNGTSNYILTSMEKDGLSFNQALLEAKKKAMPRKTQA